MQRYIERWLQIVQRLANAAPPRPGPQLLIQVDSVFQELQAPFEATKPEGRANFLNCKAACTSAAPLRTCSHPPPRNR
jgi:hypothetical protein